MSKTKLIIYWCRRDFRLNDNPALFNAIQMAQESKMQLLPIYIIDNGLLNNNSWNIGHGRRYFLSRVLANFAQSFSDFQIFTGDFANILQAISDKFEIQVYVNEDIEPYSISRDNQVRQIIEKNGGKFYSFADQLTVDKNTLTGSGNVYTVFTPFRNQVLDKFINSELAPNLSVEVTRNTSIINSETRSILDKLNLKKVAVTSEKELQAKIFDLINRPNLLHIKNNTIEINVDEFVKVDYSKLDSFWYFNEQEALSQFEHFLNHKILSYKQGRDSLELDTIDTGQTSHMSAALKWGLISSRSLKDMIINKFGLLQVKTNENLFHYISELMWREFYRYILYHFPQSLDQEFQLKFRNKIDWVEDSIALDRFRKWMQGQTGYPAVDAAMNQINSIGWMHNRSRMMVASILTKNLGVDWRWGQDYFRLMLVDMDEASNNGGWQWAASVGADPKPIRIFNPYLQAENYDKSGKYQEKWLPADYSQNVTEPVVDHKKAREEALKRYGLGAQKAIRDF